MNEYENHLYRKKKTLLEVCNELGIDVSDFPLENLETCSSCSIWYKSTELILDLDSNPICKVCKRFYGL